MVWRRDVYQAIRSAATSHGIKKYEGVDLECEVIVYLSHTKMHFHDVDNLQKHILDALQGRLGGPTGGNRRWALLPNDYQIRKVVVEKRERRSRKEQSRLTIRDFAKIERYRKAHPK
jgi:Holliday junction resolvase RusA-like endonuclease